VSAFFSGLAVALLLAVATAFLLDAAAVSSVEAVDDLSIVHEDEVEGWFIADPGT
jgi:hypothetical protein